MTTTLAPQSIPFSASIAAALGRCAALVLQQLHYWLQKSKHTADGLKWIYNTLPQWAEQLGYSVSHLKRVFARLQQLGFIRIEKRQSIQWKQINWYAIDYDRLEKWLKPLLLSNGSFWADRSAHNELIDQLIMSHSFTETTNTNLQTTNTPTRPPVVVAKAFDPSEPKEHETLFEGSATKSIGEQLPHEATDLGEGHFSAAAAEPPILAEVREAIAPAPLHPALAKRVLSYSVEVVREAIAVVKSQKERCTVKNAPGLLISAVEQKWTVATPETASKTAASGFSEWFNLARSAGLVVASQMIDGTQYVMRLTPDDMPMEEWESMRAAYPIDRLRRICDGLE